LKRHKSWFDDECLHFLDQRKQGKMQWVHDPSQNNVDNLFVSLGSSLGHLKGKTEVSMTKTKYL